MEHPSVAKPRALAVLVVVLGACTPSVHFTSMNVPPHPVAAKSAIFVEVLSIPPGRPYAEIGTVDVDLRGFASQKDVQAVMMQEAASRGCDAIVLKHPDADSAACLVYTDK